MFLEFSRAPRRAPRKLLRSLARERLTPTVFLDNAAPVVFRIAGRQWGTPGNHQRHSNQADGGFVLVTQKVFSEI